MIEHSAELDKLSAALNEAQKEIAVAKKGSQNPFFRSTYADLASVWEACREPLTKNGLSIAQFPGFVAGNPPTATVTTVLLHSSGQFIAAEAGAPLPDQKRKDGSEEKANAQGVGSAITYLRRYALAAVASVSPADDDGNAAAGKVERGGTSTAPSARGVTKVGAAASRAKSAPMPPIPTESLDVRPAAIVEGEKEPMPWDDLKWKNKLLTDFDSADLSKLRELCETKGPEKYAAHLTAIESILESRRGE